MMNRSEDPMQRWRDVYLKASASFASGVEFPAMQLAATAALVLFGLAGAEGHPGEARQKMKPTDYQETCRQIAQDVERLGANIPKLAGFSAANNLGDDCDIDYEHDTRPPPHVAGWRGGFRTAGPDGLNLYLHLWDDRMPRDVSATESAHRGLRTGKGAANRG